MVCVLLIMYSYYNLNNELVFNDYITLMFSNDFVLIMAALWNRAGHYICILSFLMAALWNRQAIIVLPCGFFLSSFFIPCIISVVTDWMSTILLHMVWP